MPASKPDTPFRDLCARCGWSARQVAFAWGYSASAGQAWAFGRYAAPKPVAAWLENMAAHMATNPPPTPLPVHPSAK